MQNILMTYYPQFKLNTDINYKFKSFSEISNV